MSQTQILATLPKRPFRRDSLDFWRGLLFCTIFVNHVPGNVFEALTSRNFGFSDSAEGFIFLSGLSLALAYGEKFAGSGSGSWRATGQMLRRAAKLYGAHIALSLAALALFGVGALLGGNRSVLVEHGRGFVFEHPAKGLLGILSLGHQLGYFNILPLYMLMLFLAPLMLWISRRSIPLMLALSGLVYLATQIQGWNLPTWPIPGTWFFDPFAWQFLLALGIVCGLEPQAAAIPRTVPLLCLALTIVIMAAWSVTDGLSLVPGLYDVTRTWAELDKSTLGAGRFIHFIALAYVLYYSGLASRLRGFVLFKPLCAIGRGSLPMFALVSALAAICQVTLNLLGHRPAIAFLVVGTGLSILYGAAIYLDSTKRGRPLGRARSNVVPEVFELQTMLPARSPEHEAVAR